MAQSPPLAKPADLCLSVGGNPLGVVCATVRLGDSVIVFQEKYTVTGALEEWSSGQSIGEDAFIVYVEGE